MKSHLTLVKLFVFCVAFGNIFSISAEAQLSDEIPAMFSARDKNFVNVIAGKINLDIGSISIGGNDGRGIEFKAMINNRGVLTHNFVNLIKSVSIDGGEENYEDVIIDNEYRRFRPSIGNCMEEYWLDGSVALCYYNNGSKFEFTNQVGVKYIFEKNNHSNQFAYGLDEIVFPNGNKQKFHYTNIPYNHGNGNIVNSKTLISVTNNFGYEIRFFYDSNGRIKDVFAINNAVEACPVLGQNCAVSGSDWQRISFGGTCGLTLNFCYNTINYNGTESRIDYGNSGLITRVRVPGLTDSSFTYHTDHSGRIKTVTKEGHSWNYTYDENIYLPTRTRVVDPYGRTSIYKWERRDHDVDFPLTSFTDENSRTTSFLRSNPNSIDKVTFPEGNFTEYSYDQRYNLIEKKFNPKPGIALNVVRVTAEYDVVCVHVLKCNQPNTITDARGSVVSFEYSSAHGGVLRETGAASIGGIPPVKRLSYVQRYARIVNPAGGYMHANEPIWLLAEERTCRETVTTGNSCSGGAADEVIKQYHYGPDSGAVGNNLLLRGVSVISGGSSSATCYGYDKFGNRISETKPLSLYNCQ